MSQIQTFSKSLKIGDVTMCQINDPIFKNHVPNAMVIITNIKKYCNDEIIMYDGQTVINNNCCELVNIRRNVTNESIGYCTLSEHLDL